MSGEAVSEEASPTYNVAEVVESVLGSEWLGLGSSHLQSVAWGELGLDAAGQ